MTRHPHRALLLAAAASAGCGNPDGPGTTSPGLSITGAGQADTVDARLTVPLRIQVADSQGVRRAGVVVRIDQVSTAQVALTGRHGALNSDVDTTGTGGTLQWTVAMGAIPGTASITVTALGFHQVVTFVIRPAALAAIRVAPADTSLYVGGTAVFRATPVDRHENVLASAVQITLGSGPLALTGPGTVQGTAIGRGTVTARSGAVTGTGFVSVVPVGIIAADVAPPSLPGIPEIATIGLDGRGFHRVLQLNINDANLPIGLAWSPDGLTLAWVRQLRGSRIEVLDLNGNSRTLVPQIFRVQGEGWPQYSRDGQWVYYAARLLFQNGAIWRVHPDGSGAETVEAEAGIPDVDAYPSPSLDGTRVAVSTNRFPPPTDPTRPGSLAILELNYLPTFSIAIVNSGGLAPRWSPVEDLIAYLKPTTSPSPLRVEGEVTTLGELRVIRAEEFGDRAVAAGLYSRGFSWSSDGQYILARSDQGYLAVIQVSTGLVLPLGWSARYVTAAWKP